MQRCMALLLRTQRNDGSWHVEESRHESAAVPRERIPARPRSMDFTGGDGVGGNGAQPDRRRDCAGHPLGPLRRAVDILADPERLSRLDLS